MNLAPVLVLQMQRMGDMVLSFPVINKLAACFPGHPIWVVGERMFVEPLLRLSPQVTYLTYDALPDITHTRFHCVLNLSHRPEAALLAAHVKSDALFGAYMPAGKAMYIAGNWQLYRASLTHNNRYNLFHWADLHGLDFMLPLSQQEVQAPSPRSFSPHNSGARIGLFLGASEVEKRPDATFWVDVTRMLVKAGYKPVLLGGPAEKKLGSEVAGFLRAPSLNLCGRFSVSDLADFIEELDLFVSPDTGPMHVAVLTGTPTLNLSMGPVHPWETGPYFPGHHVVRARLACTGCWQCRFERVMCKEYTQPGRVVAVIAALLEGKISRIQTKLAGLDVLRSERDVYGLYSLEPVWRGDPGIALTDAEDEPALQGALDVGFYGETNEPEGRLLLSRFWQNWFSVQLGQRDVCSLSESQHLFSEKAPFFYLRFQQAVDAFAASTLALPRDGKAFGLALSDQWQQWSPMVRPLSGFIQMFVHNANASPQSRIQVLQWIEQLRSFSGTEPAC